MRRQVLRADPRRSHSSQADVSTDMQTINTMATTDIPSSMEILGVRIHDVTSRETIGEMTRMMTSGGKGQIAAVNPEVIMRARTDPHFLAVLNNVTLAIPDGIGVLYGARILGGRLRERVAGVDVVENFARVAAGEGYSVFLLGGAPGVADRAAAVLTTKYPGLRVAGVHAGSPSPSEEAEICDLINAAGPDALFVAYGAPKQELWIARNIERLNVRLAMSVGGTFDFIAGETTRAPSWVREIGFEWLHRLILQPRRWRRMLALPKFAILCVAGRVLGNASTAVAHGQ